VCLLRRKKETRRIYFPEKMRFLSSVVVDYGNKLSDDCGTIPLCTRYYEMCVFLFYRATAKKV